MSAWRSTLRIARRDARRAGGRSVLVVVMIALPILGVGLADTVYRTFQLTSLQQSVRSMGAADGTMLDTGQVSVDQVSTLSYGSGPDVPQRTGPAPAPASVLPAGARVIEVRGDQANLTHGDVTVITSVTDLPWVDPMARGIYVRRAGRPATKAGEVVLATEVAQRLHAKPGDTIARGGDVLTVTGVVDSTARLHDRSALVAPGTIRGQVFQVLFDVPGPLTLAQVRVANAHGFGVTPRTPLPGLPDGTYRNRVGTTTLTFAGLIAGLVLLEVVLLAGPAFAVGVKRRSRDLALVAATGGERRHLSAIVLGGGLVLGAVGGALGAGLGILLARLLLPVFTRIQDTRPGPFEVRPVEMLGIVGIGVVTALLAALLPARTAARTDVLAALTGRRGNVRSGRRLPALGVVATAAGTGLALYGAHRYSTNLVLAGSIVAELGLVATTPFLVGLLARLGRFLPVGPRFALRDAARNRGRTAPAVAAILAAVAGAIAVSTFIGSLDRHQRALYRASAPAGALTIDLTYGGAGHAAEIERVLRTTLPGTAVTTVRGVAERKASQVLVRIGPEDNPKRVCPGVMTTAQVAALRSDPRCAQGLGYAQLRGPFVGGAATLRAVTGATGKAYDDVLARGGAVVPWYSLQDDGTARLTVRSDQDGKVLRTVTVPAVALPVGHLGAVVLSPKAADALGQKPAALGVIALGPHAPTAHEEDRARNAIDALGLPVSLQVERGYESRYGIGLLALLVGSAVIVLGASGTATGLAAADGRADLATLAAVGATPGTRRVLAAFQSATTAGLGTVLGVVAGLVPGLGVVLAVNAAARTSNAYDVAYPVSVPWTNVLVTLLVVPALAALAAAALTRSKLPVVRRVA